MQEKKTNFCSLFKKVISIGSTLRILLNILKTKKHN